MIVCFIFVRFNEAIENRLIGISKKQTNNALNIIVYKVLDKLDYENKELISYKRSENGSIVYYEYNTKVLNAILKESINSINTSLEKAKQGEKDPILNEVLFKDGVMVEIPVGYFTGVNFLSNLGFKIKLDMPLYQYVDGSLKIDSKEYGINNSLVTVFLCLEIKADLIGNKEELVFKEEIPIIIQVVEGKVPSIQIKRPVN